MAVFLCGCGRSNPTDDSKMQAHIAILESRVAALDQKNDEWIYKIAYLSVIQTNTEASMEKLRGDLRDLRFTIEVQSAEIASLHTLVTNLYFGDKR